MRFHRATRVWMLAGIAFARPTFDPLRWVAMTPSRRAFIVVIALAVILCAGTYYVASRAELPPIVATQPIVMKMRRLCEACPNYTITLISDGVLTYEGTDHARVQGVHTVFVDREIVTELLADFVQSEFLELDNIYPAPGSDRMVVTISIEMSDLSKSVLSEDRYGPALLELERKMDDLPGIRRLSGWTH